MKRLVKIKALGCLVYLVQGDHMVAAKEMPARVAENFDTDRPPRYTARTASFYPPARYHGKGYHTAVWIHNTSAAISVWAHEALHAAEYIIAGIGDKVGPGNEEVRAYLVSHICEAAEDMNSTYDQ